MRDLDKIPANFDWGPLGRDWWLEQGEFVNATGPQTAFASKVHGGMARNHAAEASGYCPGYEAKHQEMRTAGSLAYKSAAVQKLLAVAAAEDGELGPMTPLERRKILERLARGGDAQAKLRAMEALDKLDEREARAPGVTLSPEEIIARLTTISPLLALLTARRNNIPCEASPITISAALAHIEWLRSEVLASADIAEAAVPNGHAADASLQETAA